MKKRILVVDDEWAILELLRFRLSRRGYDVVTAQNDKEFEREVQEHPPDLILLDVWLGDKIGTEVYDRFLKKGLDPKIPVIFITALVGEGEPPKKACNGGKYALYGKPFDFGELLMEIKQLLSFADEGTTAA